jgi:Carboxypeptidase regulatory-like domain
VKQHTRSPLRSWFFLLGIATVLLLTATSTMPGSARGGGSVHSGTFGSALHAYPGPLARGGIASPMSQGFRDRSALRPTRLNQLTWSLARMSSQSTGQSAWSAVSDRRAAAPVTNPSTLILPDAAWPSGLNQNLSKVVDAAWADTSGPFQPPYYHTVSYASSGMKTGYAQQWTRTTPSGIEAASWLGSIYDTTDQAAAMATDGKTTLRHLQGVTVVEVSPCSAELPTCSLFSFTGHVVQTSTDVLVLYAVWSQENVVGEALMAVPASIASDDPTVVATSFATLLKSAAAVVTAATNPSTPTPTVTASPTPTPTLAPIATATATPTSTPSATATTVPTPRQLIVKVSGIPRAGHAGTLQVRVRRSDTGRPVAHAHVSLDARAVGIPSVRHSTTTSQGRATFASLHPVHPGRMAVRATKSGFGSTTVHATVRR